MAANHLPYELRQMLLLPEAIQDGLAAIAQARGRLEQRQRDFGVPEDRAQENFTDAGELPVMLRAVKDNLCVTPEQALADTGYRRNPGGGRHHRRLKA